MTAPGSGNLDVPFRGPAVTPALSPRQRAIFELLAEGLARKEVAGRLGLSFHTVRNDIENVYAHLDTGNLVTAFHRLGWVRVPGLGDYEHELLGRGHVPGEYRVLR